MLNTVRLRGIYSKIQTELFYMIPEKWDKIYLYASIIERMNNLETGEMFFYYYPKGILKKNPVNVYEIPAKFNIDEKSYMKLVNDLYETIKLLKKEFEDAGEKPWTNLTISIENLKFHVEYDYENLEETRYSNYDRHIIWQYKYLDLAVERLSKKDRKMLDKYLVEEQFQNKETKKYTEGMYRKNVHNIVEYNKIESGEEQLYETNQTFTSKTEKQEEKQLDKYELYKLKKEQEKQKQIGISNIIKKQDEKKKNQILNF